jgi:RHS repeat-associated protein
VSGSTPLLLSDGSTDYIYGVGGTPIEQVTARAAITLWSGTGASGGATTTSLTLGLTSQQVNDQVVVASTQSSATTVTAPPSYTLVSRVVSGGSSPAATSVYRHTVVTGDTSVTLTYGGTNSAKAVTLDMYRGVDPSHPVDVFGAGSSTGSSTVTGLSVSPAYANDRLLVVQGATGKFSSSTWTAPSGTVERSQVSTTHNVSAGLADQALTAAGATGTRTSTFSTTANLTTVVIALDQTPSVLFYQSDQLGSTRMLTDNLGVVRGTFTYDAYGNLAGFTGSYSSPLAYAGQYLDSESGLYYLRARFYDPATAQFMSVDPMVATTRSPYGYVAENPLSTTDPTGLDVCNRYAENYLCELTLQYCATSATAYECHDVGQAVVDTYNEVAKELTTLQAQSQGACPTNKIEQQINLLIQARDELKQIYVTITTQALPNFNNIESLPSPASVFSGMWSCGAAGLAGAEVGAAGLPIPVVGELTTMGGAVLGCGFGIVSYAVTGVRFSR